MYLLGVFGLTLFGFPLTLFFFDINLHVKDELSNERVADVQKNLISRFVSKNSHQNTTCDKTRLPPENAEFGPNLQRYNAEPSRDK
ncbi:hypothetical protein CEXT_595651 [Caerostris extrusa]|uniref:Uncharacterized protein n=1 Tax=Caerostris extrusa TaxID=172846 RepID=A0AAV4XYT7_CAEEX|nr:hypothetical protein CEXT_595651 [Caerostris extrusa]